MMPYLHDAMTFAPVSFAALWYLVRFIGYLARDRQPMLFHDPVPMRTFFSFALLSLSIGLTMPPAAVSIPVLFAFSIAPAWLLCILFGGPAVRIMLHASLRDHTVVASPL